MNQKIRSMVLDILAITESGEADVAFRLYDYLAVIVNYENQKDLEILSGININMAEVSYIKNGGIITAIKAVKRRTGLSLKNAKEIVDMARARLDGRA